MKPITSDRDQMKQDFTSKLPKDLGKPYIMNTFDSPLVFVSFFPGQRHELADGRIIHGNEFRLLEYGGGFKSKKMLAGVIGLQEYPPAFVVLALASEGTTMRNIKPYRKMISEMYQIAASPQRTEP